jgi:hypothetical protein
VPGVKSAPLSVVTSIESRKAQICVLPADA